MSARLIYDTAPLGSLIRFSNGEQHPPRRFGRKLEAWNAANGIGRLTKRTPEHVARTYRSPAGFCLHLGNYGGQDITVLVVSRQYSVESALHFEIADVPSPGMVRVLSSFNGRDELHHLAPDIATAERWMANNHYSNMRAEVVSDSDTVVLPSAMGRAA